MNTAEQQIDEPESADGGLPLDDKEYQELRELILEITGIQLADNKQAMMRRRLSRRLQELGLDNFSEYCEFLRSGNPDEREQFANAVTTNLTAFFRENHHFEYLASSLLPELIEEAHRTGKKIRIWSAGCSTGEEPYSIAMLINELCPAPRSVDIKILATDLDSSALAHCKAGVYSLDRVEKIPAERLRRWFSRGTGRNEGLVRIRPELRELISFRRLNLMSGWPMKGPFDVIFCRNVIIYFDKATQKRLIERYADILRPGGHLFIGHSESLLNMTERFTLLGKTIYKKA
ncbi:MAG TPA: chemotaxis protein CheR [Chromatiales bacterium]|nr:chemotaxis protein CheR [Chromatiales bacterium]